MSTAPPSGRDLLRPHASAARAGLTCHPAAGKVPGRDSSGSLAEITRLAPPPPVPRHATTDWPATEQALGGPVPDDFKILTARYGRGDFCDLVFLHPPDAVVGENAELAEWREVRESSPYPIHPEPGGVLIWGGTSNGGRLCRVTEGRPADWPVVVWQPRGAGRGPRPYEERLRILRDALAPTAARAVTVGTDGTRQEQFTVITTRWRVLCQNASAHHQIQIDVPHEEEERARDAVLRAVELMACEVVSTQHTADQPRWAPAPG